MLGPWRGEKKSFSVDREKIRSCAICVHIGLDENHGGVSCICKVVGPRAKLRDEYKMEYTRAGLESEKCAVIGVSQCLPELPVA